MMFTNIPLSFQILQTPRPQLFTSLLETNTAMVTYCKLWYSTHQLFHLSNWSK